MAAVVFDTLILSRKLAAADMPVDQAQGVAAAVAETLREQLATRRDIEDVRRDLEATRHEMVARMDQLDAKQSARIDQLDAKQSARIDQLDAKQSARVDLLEQVLRSELRQSEQRQTIRLVMMLASGLAVVATLVKLL